MSGGAGTGNSPRRVIKPQRRYMPSSAEQVEERSRLLSKMDAFYREACARLAVEASPATLARFLNAGVSVGLLDPVSNIMANTLVTSDIGPDLMDKDKVFDDTKLGEMAKRSLDGLVAFLVYFFPYLAGWDALRYLLVADADLLVAARLIVADRGMMGFSITSLASVPAFQAALRLAAQVSKHPQPQRFANVWMSLSSQLQQVMAIQNQPHAAKMEGERQRQQCRTSTPGLYDAVRKVEQQRPCASAKEAYEAASTAALHPDPEAHAVFLSSTKEMLKGPALLLLQTGDQLTSENVQFLASLFSSRQKPTPEQIEKKNPYPVLAGKRRSEAQQRRIKTKVKAALGKHLLQDGEPMYELHIICGANENVGSPEYCDDQDVDVYDDDACRAPCKFCYSHVNFLVTRKDSPAGSYPLLFFAEFDDDEEGKSLCCRVDVPTPFAEHVRCLYCESEGTKLVHPASGKFHGREELFEEAICEDRNDWLICENEYAVQHMYAVDEDFMYIDMRCIS
ncbi:hypothetical protein BRADI_2g10600v3 [Brachypodium distachyon]|uniref:Uncharacterized protein n=1 Tax=Brachypodium distachyon TaxID=15368 RepID=A0A2K2D7U7_BRADI|nr:hypothetical protein BRADI_2g10600v3 [Brachypodium distachyon]